MDKYDIVSGMFTDGTSTFPRIVWKLNYQPFTSYELDTETIEPEDSETGYILKVLIITNTGAELAEDAWASDPIYINTGSSYIEEEGGENPLQPFGFRVRWIQSLKSLETFEIDIPKDPPPKDGGNCSTGHCDPIPLEPV